MENYMITGDVEVVQTLQVHVDLGLRCSGYRAQVHIITIFNVQYPSPSSAVLVWEFSALGLGARY